MMSESEYESDSSSNEAQINHQTKNATKPEKRRPKPKYVQMYNSNWEKIPLFKGWLTSSSKGQQYFHCTVCSADYLGCKSDVIKHASTKKHKSKLTGHKNQVKLNTMPALSQFTTLNNKIKEAEIRIASFVVEHNVAFNVVDHLTELIKSIPPDVAKKISLGRTKCTAIVQNVTGTYSFENIISILQTEKFSLMVDESTDKGCVKNLALVVRIICNSQIKDYFLTLISVSSATGESIYNKIVNFFENHRIPYKTNMIGLASDGASNMVGEHNSLWSRLKQDIPSLFLMKCICHSFALCANYACEKLPRIVEDVVRDIYNYLSNSYKRLTDFKEFQDFVNIKPHKILRLSQTRWLSLLCVVKRVIEQYDALKLYFASASLSDRLLAADMILQRLNEPYTLMYLQFLEFVLPLFNRLNVEMQSEEFKLHILYVRVKEVFKTILDCFIKSSYLIKTPVEEVNFLDPHNYVDLDNLYLGSNLQILLGSKKNLDPIIILDFKKKCLAFFIESCSQIKKRFNFKDSHIQLIKELRILDPKNVLQFTSIAPLAMKFPNLISQNDIQDLDTEWRLFRNFEINFEIPSSTVCFWRELSKIKTDQNESKFPLLSGFMMNLHCLPHSSAAVERIFSKINLNKTAVRNRLENKSLVGILHTNQLIHWNNQMCYDYEINEPLKLKLNNDMYNKK